MVFICGKQKYVYTVHFHDAAYNDFFGVKIVSCTVEEEDDPYSGAKTSTWMAEFEFYNLTDKTFYKNNDVEVPPMECWDKTIIDRVERIKPGSDNWLHYTLYDTDRETLLFSGGVKFQIAEDYTILNVEMFDDEELKRQEETYMQITMEDAKQIFEVPGEYVIVDVRRPDEYAAGHIPGAINVVNEEIGAEKPALLPDLNQRIFVYCRSGNRSKQAAAKLVGVGYTDVVEFGGILDWTGNIEK